MLPHTKTRLERWWAELLGVEPSALWRSATARPHGTLGDYPGYFVAWRHQGVHVSLPKGADPDVAETLGRREIASLQDPAFWHEFAQQRGLAVIGPSTHAYLDVDPGTDPGVAAIGSTDLTVLQSLVPQEDWEESGFADGPAHAFGLHERGVLVAASNLTSFDSRPRDIGVLVAPSARGRGLASVVGRHAAAFAVREHGLARWTARDTNLASLATARRLGFEPWCTQLAIRQS